VINSHFTRILLTYKGKVLLTIKESHPNVLQKTFWHFIGGLTQKNKSEEETITKIVEKETSIKLESVELLSTQDTDTSTEYYYCAKLSDENVNNMQRAEGQLINFFAFSELDKLSLSNSTRQFISKHRDVLDNIRNN
jgi:ADP-ribose pyrophosphatase YjhB (NUDIX family)